METSNTELNKVELEKNHKKITKYRLLAGLFMFFALGFSYYSGLKRKYIEVELPTINKEILILDNVSDELDTIKGFIGEQKKYLLNQESMINELKNKNDKLKNKINIDKDRINSMFKYRQEKSWINKIQELLFGFLIGIASSIIASISYNKLSKQRLKRRLTQSK